MAILTLEPEEVSCPWPRVEAKLANGFPSLEVVSQAEHTRTYRVDFPDHGDQIAELKKLQSILTHDEIHFFVDLKS